MNTRLHHDDQQNHETIRFNGEPSCQFQAPMSYSPTMAFFPTSGQHGQATYMAPRPLMVVPLLAYPPGYGDYMHGLYDFPGMMPAQLQPQRGTNYTWACPYLNLAGSQPSSTTQQAVHCPGRNFYQPYSILDDLESSCSVGHVDFSSKTVQTKETGHAQPEASSQDSHPPYHDGSLDVELFPGCGPEFAKTLSKVMTKTSHRLMALLQDELDRLDKLEAKTEAVGDLHDFRFASGIKPGGGMDDKNGELVSTITNGEEPCEGLSTLKAAGRPQASNDPATLDQVTMAEKLGVCRLNFSRLQPHASLITQTSTGCDGSKNSDSHKGHGTRGAGKGASV